MADARWQTVLRHVRGLAGGHHADGLNDGALLRAFAAANDQAAFTALVRRHGALVLAVCRRVLHDLHDAEDAFQATFILLARNAAAVGKHESAAGWLHETAFRTASNARRARFRRQKHERSAPTMRVTSPAWDAVWREVQVVLDEEVQRLPAIYREAFVLCCLENRSAAEAARVLGVQEGTVGSRLTRARLRLREALTRRGVSLSAVLGMAALAGGTGAARASGALVTSTVRAAALLAAGNTTAAGAISANVAELLAKAGTAMIMTKRRTTALAVLVLTLAAVGEGAYRLAAGPAPGQGPPAAAPDRPGAGPPAAGQGTGPSAATKPEKERAAESVEVRGRVLDPDGQPVAGAQLFLAKAAPRTGPWPDASHAATSGADGRFRFSVPRSELDEGSATRSPSQVMAVADGYGCDWGELGRGDNEMTLRLVNDMPVRGRILDPDGKPVAGAKLSVWGVGAPKGDDVGYALESVRKGNFGWDFARTWTGPVPGQPVLTTDADGRFRLAGLGRERGVMLRLEGPGLATEPVQVLTRSFDTITGPSRWRRPGPSVHGASFEHLAVASRPIRGVVRDQATGKPLAGVSVKGEVLPPWCEAVTDKEGRYELLGLAKSPHYPIVVKPAAGQLYLERRAQVDDAPGLGALTADFELVAGGLTLRGKVTDKATGKPVAQTRVEYYPLYGNPNVNKLGVSEPRSEATTGPDGSYTLTALPGVGVIGVTGPRPEAYAPARVTLQDQKDFFKGMAPPFMQENFLNVATGGNDRGGLYQLKYNALALFDLGETEKAPVKDVGLEPARALQGRVLGPDDQPLAGATVFGLGGDGASRYRPEILKGAEFTVKGVNPRESRWLVFHHGDKNLGFFVKELRGDASGPLTVKLQPCGSASGRIVYPDGQPVPGLRLDFQANGTSGGLQEAATDKEGRFRAEGLVPGLEYDVVPRQYAPLPLAKVSVESGKQKDLGDIKAQLDK